MSFPTNSRPGQLDPEQLLDQLNLRFPKADRYWVGFSGGLDSSVLLNLLASVRQRLRAPLSAIHIDHDLQAGSAGWASHCREVCERLGVELCSLVVDASAKPGESPEAAARVARYRALAETVGCNAMLLTAHHLDDQAETLLLQLLRGAGVDGLAAMPLIRKWHRGWHARPLLGVRRHAIKDWAVENGIRWLDDPSNAVVAADRNYLRHQVLPGLVSRWPGAVAGIARSAAHCADAADLTRLQAEKDLELVLQDGRLEIAPLSALSPVRARNVLRYWLRERNAPAISQRRLNDALDQLCNARRDAAVRLTWGGVELRRFRGQAWLLPLQREISLPPAVDWVGEEMRLGEGLGRIRRYWAPGGIDPDRWEQGRVRIAYRNTGFRCRPAGREGSRTFKKLAQEYGIPPWLRSIVPILLIDDEPAAVADYCVCAPFVVERGRSGWLIEWFPEGSSPEPEPSSSKLFNRGL